MRISNVEHFKLQSHFDSIQSQLASKDYVIEKLQCSLGVKARHTQTLEEKVGHLQDEKKTLKGDKTKVEQARAAQDEEITRLQIKLEASGAENQTLKKSGKTLEFLEEERAQHCQQSAEKYQAGKADELVWLRKKVKTLEDENTALEEGKSKQPGRTQILVENAGEEGMESAYRKIADYRRAAEPRTKRKIDDDNWYSSGTTFLSSRTIS
ncbi:hypothetical protein BJ170DRAFT_726096 [Xylariales sp. AK1849]|nr:hypothetical protein BJ170DRAFT_726096 [Xylariales sp. AK1849]